MGAGKKFYKPLIIFLSAILMILPVNVFGKLPTNDGNKEITDFIRGYEIEFKPPSIVLDCLSFFNLNITIKRARPTLPSLVSVFVYLYIPSEKYGDKVSLIGFSPYVYIPAIKEKMSISIPCITSNRLFEKLTCFESGEKEEFALREGYIGVSLSRARNTGIKGIILGAVWKKYYEYLMEKDMWLLLTSNTFPLRILNSLILSNLLIDCKLFMKRLSPFTVWKRVNVSSPFVCSDKIKMRLIKHSNETDNKGKFNVTIEVENGLDIDINASILVDLSSKPFINALFPTAKITRYNAGHTEFSLPAGETIRYTINCSFPPGGFIRKNYTVRVECGPYIPIGNSNQFGIYTFNIRWVGLIKPNYQVNATVEEVIKRFWYNLPIFGKGGETEFLPYAQFKIKYEGEAPEGTVEMAVNKISKEIKYWLALLFLLILTLIIIALLGYRFIIREKK